MKKLPEARAPSRRKLLAAGYDEAVVDMVTLWRQAGYVVSFEPGRGLVARRGRTTPAGYLDVACYPHSPPRPRQLTKQRGDPTRADPPALKAAAGESSKSAEGDDNQERWPPRAAHN
jgi:hypothetical protein